MHRFYLPSISNADRIIEIKDPRVVQQCHKVLRMKPGNRLSVFNDDGDEWAIELVNVDRKKMIGNVVEKITRNTESPIKLHLYQAIPKKPALFELVIQKATELGVSHIYPLITARTEGRKLLKFERLKLIAIEATEQCRRTTVPTIHHPVELETALQNKPSFIAYEFEADHLLAEYQSTIKKAGVAHVFIGPEGGYDTKEIALAKKTGAHSFSLGPRILRTETAAIVAVSQLLVG